LIVLNLLQNVIWNGHVVFSDKYPYSSGTDTTV
jgi:hypothetical protein